MLINVVLEGRNRHSLSKWYPTKIIEGTACKLLMETSACIEIRIFLEFRLGTALLLLLLLLLLLSVES